MSIESLCAILTTAVAIVSLFSTIINTIINNIYQYRFKTFSFMAEKKLKIYQNFIDEMNLNLTPGGFTKEQSLSLKKTFSKVYIICSDETRLLLDEFENYLSQNHSQYVSSGEKYRKLHREIIKALRADLSSLH